MATRFWLPNTGAAAVSPSFTGWTNTTGADRIKCVTTKISSTMTTKTYSIEDTGAPYNDLWRQYVSDPLSAQTISGTVKGIIRCAENITNVTGYPQIRIRVCNQAGDSFTGTLLDFNNNAVSNEFAVGATLVNRKFPRNWSGAGTSLSSLAINANDRLVIEIGFRQDANNEGAETCSASFGDDAGSDLAEDETSSTANNPWLEFSQDLFGPPPQQLDQIVREILFRGA